MPWVWVSPCPCPLDPSAPEGAAEATPAKAGGADASPPCVTNVIDRGLSVVVTSIPSETDTVVTDMSGELAVRKSSSDVVDV